MHEVYNFINSLNQGIAVLIDPDKFRSQNSTDFFQKITVANPDFVFIGGSTVSSFDFDFCIETVKKKLKFPIVIFPGASHHINKQADAILFLSLISGRNPDYLIGHHIAAAEELEKMNLEVIPTSYILVDGGKKTTVEFISQTTPLPRDQFALARRIALAGKLQGKKITYLDAGSGAQKAISTDMINNVKSIGTPLIVGGGIRSIEQIQKCHKAGANVVVIGNAIENDVDFLLDIANYRKFSVS
jgi:putative glycerol-1-phosphate prenyltransferase